MEGDLGADRIGVIAGVGEQRLHLAADHAEQWAEAVDVVRLAGRQHEAERSPLASQRAWNLAVKPGRLVFIDETSVNTKMT